MNPVRPGVRPSISTHPMNINIMAEVFVVCVRRGVQTIISKPAAAVHTFSLAQGKETHAYA